MSEEYLAHYGVKGMKWYEHKFGDWERHAMYAMGKPNPDTNPEMLGKYGGIDPSTAAISTGLLAREYGMRAKKNRDIESASNPNTREGIASAKNNGLYGVNSAVVKTPLPDGIQDKLMNVYGSIMDKLPKNIKKTNLNIDEATGFKLKTKDYTSEQDMERVNPFFFTNQPDFTRNCMYCTTAYEMRKRGYDVQANRIDCQGFDTDAVKRWFPKAECITITNVFNTTKNNAIDSFLFRFNLKDPIVAPTLAALRKQGEGARGMLFIKFKDGWGGHCVSYEITDGKLKIRDPQANITYTNPADLLKGCYDSRYMRLDNVDFDIEGIKEAIH